MSFTEREPNEDSQSHIRKQLESKDTDTQEAFLESGSDLRTCAPPVQPLIKGSEEVEIRGKRYSRTRTPGMIEYRTEIEGMMYTDTQLRKYVAETQDTNFIMKPTAEWYMYVLLRREGHVWLYMHEYVRDHFWFSKHGVILSSQGGSQLSMDVVCAGIISFAVDDYIYLDDQSGTLAPSRESLLLAAKIIGRYFRKDVLAVDSQMFTAAKRNRSTITDLMKRHPDLPLKHTY